MILERENILENGEVILATIRKHWIVYAYNLIAHLIVTLLFLFVIRFLVVQEILGGIYLVEEKLGTVLLAGLALIVWTSFFYWWTKNYFEVWYVTDRRVIAVSQKQIFDHEETYIPFSQVEDIILKSNGWLAPFFGYGNIRVTTSNGGREFFIERVADANYVARKIVELRDDARQEPVIYG